MILNARKNTCAIVPKQATEIVLGILQTILHDSCIAVMPIFDTTAVQNIGLIWRQEVPVNKILLSAFMGLLFAVPVYLICFFIIPECAFILALCSGLLFCLLLLVFLCIYEIFGNRKYIEFEKGMSSPIFYKTNGNFYRGNGKIRNCTIYFCEAGILCAGIAEKPYTVDEILIEDIEKFQFDPIHLNIYTKDNRRFLITTPDAEKIIQLLKMKDWI